MTADYFYRKRFRTRAMIRRLNIAFVTLLACALSLGGASAKDFVRVEDARFMIGDDPYYFLGANLWFGMNLASEGPGGDRARLVAELDHLQALGITNLRVMAGSDGPADEPFRVHPALQNPPGQFDDQLLEGLDFLLAEMGKRDMRAVMVLTNFFQWTGGMAQHVAWAQNVPIPYPHHEPNTWDEFQNFSARFYADERAQEIFRDFVSMLISRENSITGLAYRDDPTIMSWQLGNEPRGFDHHEAYVLWVDEAARMIKELAPRQLVSLGGEGKLTDLERTHFERVSRSPYLDYLTIHLWIENWSWYDPADAESTFYTAMGRALGYIADHVALAREFDKPLVLEEFGVSRDGRVYHEEAPVTYRDRFFEVVFEAIHKLSVEGNVLVGSNFWSWSGQGRPVEPGEFWSVGDPFTGDPPHEEQGWYSIYDRDESTLAVIARHAARMNALNDQSPSVSRATN
jgi:mannan endo-1,4-beta-mannosidase